MLLPPFTPSLSKPLRQCLKFGRVQIGNDPVIHAGLGPMNEMIALARLLLNIPWLVPRIRPNEVIDEMLTSAINDSCHGPSIQIIQAPADKREPLFFQVGRRRREI